MNETIFPLGEDIIYCNINEKLIDFQLFSCTPQWANVRFIEILITCYIICEAYWIIKTKPGGEVHLRLRSAGAVRPSDKPWLFSGGKQVYSVPYIEP